MNNTDPQSNGNQVDKQLLKKFAKGELDEEQELDVLKLLEAHPALQAKVAAISTTKIVAKMKLFRLEKSVDAKNSVLDQVMEDTVQGISETTSKKLLVSTQLALLEEYRIIREIGRGGMGVIYLAENLWMGNRPEVLKVLNESMYGNHDAKVRFQQEIEFTAALDHPNIVKSHSVRHLKGMVVFAMECIAGRNLLRFINETEQVSIRSACQIAMQICAGLQHAMSKNLVHRDIKPSNIMLHRTDGQLVVKILDFGLARLSVDDQSKELIQDGTLLGTLKYIAPEQSLNAAAADIRSDIYSLGCTLYHLLVGHPPFSGTAEELIHAHSQKSPPAINLIRPDIPEQLAAVVAKMLAKEPRQRFQTPKEVSDALAPFANRQKNNSGNGPASPNILAATSQKSPSRLPTRKTFESIVLLMVAFLTTVLLGALILGLIEIIPSNGTGFNQRLNQSSLVATHPDKRKNDRHVNLTLEQPSPFLFNIREDNGTQRTNPT